MTTNKIYWIVNWGISQYHLSECKSYRTLQAAQALYNNLDPKYTKRLIRQDDTTDQVLHSQLGTIA